MSEPKQGNFEGWAIVEMLGHQREIGYVTTESFGAAVLFRIDVPELPEREHKLTRPEYIDDYGTMAAGSKVRREAMPARTRMVAPAALYAMNPCTKEAALAAIEASIVRKIVPLENPKGEKILQIAAADQAEANGYFVSDDDYDQR